MKINFKILYILLPLLVLATTPVFAEELGSETNSNEVVEQAEKTEASDAKLESHSKRRHQTLFFTTGIQGHFGDVSCSKKQSPAVFPHLVTAVQDAKSEMALAGEPEPLVLNIGDNIWPGALSRFVLAQGEEGADRLVSWLKHAGYDYLALGVQDFLSVPQRFGLYVDAAKRSGILGSVANLDCVEKDAEGCPVLGHTERFRIFERDGFKIAVFTVIHGALAEMVPVSHLDRLSVVEPIERAREVIKEARAAGADLVIGVSQLDLSESAPSGAILFARALPDLDLLVANSFQESSKERSLELIRFGDGATTIVGSQRGGQLLAEVRLDLTRQNDGSWQLEDIAMTQRDPMSFAADEEISIDLRAAEKSYCEEWNRPVGQGVLKEPMSATDFSIYLMEVMRHETRSEIAFVHRGIVDEDSVFPLEGTISSHDFFSGIPHRNHLYTFTLKAKDLKALCASLSKISPLNSEDDILYRGLACGKKIKVNGHAVAADDEFVAVTSEYLAKGALGLFRAQTSKMKLWQVSDTDEAPILGKMARDFLRGDYFISDEPVTIDIESNFSNLERNLRWKFLGNIDLNIADTRIKNAPAYEENQLLKDNFFALRGDARGKISAESLVQGFSVDARIKYAKGAANDEELVEIDDLDTLELLYRFNGLRGTDPSFWVPILYGSTNIETELTKPEEGRDFHHLELTAAAGLRFKLATKLEAKVGPGVRQEMFDPDADPVAGIDFGYELGRTRLFEVWQSPLEVESKLSAFYGDMAKSDALKGTLVNRAYFALAGSLFFNITHELFFFRKSGQDFGLSSQLTFGLSLRGVSAIQNF
ncbi:hypothetical protein KAI87_02365 [Myxococcota bacterium]|nr:hypothetical protein [Myxococcota bacterium]